MTDETSVDCISCGAPLVEGEDEKCLDCLAEESKPARRPATRGERRELTRLLDELTEAQQGFCAMCGEAQPFLELDVDGRDGYVGGALCHSCVIVLAKGHRKTAAFARAVKFQKDKGNYARATKYRKAAQYLTRVEQQKESSAE